MHTHPARSLAAALARSLLQLWLGPCHLACLPSAGWPAPVGWPLPPNRHGTHGRPGDETMLWEGPSSGPSTVHHPEGPWEPHLWQTFLGLGSGGPEEKPWVCLCAWPILYDSHTLSVQKVLMPFLFHYRGGASRMLSKVRVWKPPPGEALVAWEFLCACTLPQLH